MWGDTTLVRERETGVGRPREEKTTKQSQNEDLSIEIKDEIVGGLDDGGYLIVCRLGWQSEE